MAGNLFILPVMLATDPVNGVPLSGGKLYFYENGTTTKKDTYQDSDLTTPHTNPVIADAGGYFPIIWLDGVYSWKLTDSDDVQIDTDDDLAGAVFSNVAATFSALVTLNGGYVNDPEHASDSGTDALVSTTNTSTPGDDKSVIRDFQSANTTTTPTLDAKTITDRDGSALWAGAINGVHELQYASGTDTYLLLHPRPTAANVNDAPVARDGSGNAKFADPSADADAATKGWALAAPGTSSDPALAFDTWRTPNADRSTFVSVVLVARTDGTSSGIIDFEVDEGGGTTVDYNAGRSIAWSTLPSSSRNYESVSAIIPAGASYRFNNISDPQTANSIEDHRESPL